MEDNTNERDAGEEIKKVFDRVVEQSTARGCEAKGGSPYDGSVLALHKGRISGDTARGESLFPGAAAIQRALRRCAYCRRLRVKERG